MHHRPIQNLAHMVCRETDVETVPEKNPAAQPRLTISRQPVRERCSTHAENIPKMRHIHPPPVPLPTDCMPLEVGSDVSS